VDVTGDTRLAGIGVHDLQSFAAEVWRRFSDGEALACPSPSSGWTSTDSRIATNSNTWGPPTAT
jgi:hypothetical protein